MPKEAKVQSLHIDLPFSYWWMDSSALYTVWGRNRTIIFLDKLGLGATTPVFGVSDKARLKPVSSAIEISWKNEISFAARLDMILSKMWKTNALISLRGSPGWSAPRRPGFLRRGPIVLHVVLLFSSAVWTKSEEQISRFWGQLSNSICE